MNNVEILEKNLKYRFNSLELLRNSITHRSASQTNNERLEFLGDSILNFVITSEIYKRHTNLKEGELSRLRASMVRKETLCAIANKIDLGDFLYLGSGEKKSGGFRCESILADALEAIIGAIYLDSYYNMDTTQNVIVNLYRNRLNAVPDLKSLKDSKTILQEYLQSQKLDLPSYELLKTEGMAHEQDFIVGCFIESLRIKTSGRDKSRKKAEQKAAKEALIEIKNK
ncbi:MAG: ribonuclease III [Gammaproteobacteria bacterium]|nr:MAG: ribonuclease III [Gammaproteobacteria bacterium]